MVAAHARVAVRVTAVEPGRLAIGVYVRIGAGAEARVVPCRTPRLAINPAAAAVITALGGSLPER